MIRLYPANATSFVSTNGITVLDGDIIDPKVEEEINKFDQENNINEVKKKCYSKNFEQINSYFEAN